MSHAGFNREDALFVYEHFGEGNGLARKAVAGCCRWEVALRAWHRLVRPLVNLRAIKTLVSTHDMHAQIHGRAQPSTAAF